jgi:hypothetical protein
MLRHMKAIRAFYDRAEYPDGAIVEMSIWIVPDSVPGSSHAFKYSLYYGYPGRRVVGYDNERGKGDHRHVGDREESYPFSSVETLIADFLSDVKRARGAL